MKKICITTLASVVLFSFSAYSEPSADYKALLKRMEQLEAQVQEMRAETAKYKKQAEEAQATTNRLVANAPANTKVKSGTYEVAEPAGGPKISLDKKGLSVTSPDGEYALRMKGYAHLDSRFFLNDDNGTDAFIARRLRPVIEAQMGKYFSFKLMPDFGSNTVTVQDAYAEFTPSSAFKLRFGKFKTPLGLERLQSSTDLTFIERGMPNNLVANRDFGLMAYGDLADDSILYQFGVFNGNPDLSSNNGDEDDAKDIAGRIFVHPFKLADIQALKGFGVGLAGSIGDRQGSTSAPNLADFRSPGQERMFRYRLGGAAATTTIADGTHWRLVPQGYFYYDSFGLMAEYVASSQEVRIGAVNDTLDHDAWQVSASYVLTGEKASYKGVNPANPFDLESDGWGAWEIAARYGVLDIDDDAFPLFADAASSITSAREWAAALNWYMTDNFKLNVDFAHTVFDGGAATGGDRESENVIMTRVAVEY